MSQRSGNVSSSFNDADSKNRPIGEAKLIDEESHVYKSLSQENWCSAWAPDCSYVAWSQGGGIVYLLPWNRDAGKLLKKPSRDLQDENEILVGSPPFTLTLPRLDAEASEPDIENRRLSLTDVSNQRKSYRIDTGNVVWSMAFGSGISETNIKVWRRFIFNRDLILATGLQNGKIKLWNVFTGNLLMDLLDHKSAVRSLNFASDGSLQLVSCSNDCTLKFWNLNEDGNMFRTLKFEKPAMMLSCKWSPNCKQVAAVGAQKNVCLWSNDNWTKPLKLLGHYHTVASCDFSPDGAILATASFDTTVILWDAFTGECLKKLGHLYPAPSFIYAGGANDHYVRDVSFSRDGLNLVTVADDNYLRFWDIGDPSNPQCVAPVNNPLCCGYSPNGVVSAGTSKGAISFFKSARNGVVSLQHLCRLAVRRKVPTTQVDQLHYPPRLKLFLKYRE